MIELRPIGMVHSPVKKRGQMPKEGVGALVEVFPGFADGLLQIEKRTHLWILGWIDGGERDLLQVTNHGKMEPHGVFAVRSPARPNPIGLTLVRVVAIDGRNISVAGLDFLDETPVIDIKPFMPSRDVIPDSNG
jgi:tRNA-Thr(GGU) m(6)t(6)A37 methyltransferase TsaA